MIKAFLVPHNKIYAKSMSLLSSAPQVKGALGLTNDQASLKGTVDFIEFIIEQENIGNQYSRVILNENEDLIGVITLKDINKTNKNCHIGTWIGHQYWSKGYNELAKSEILIYCFHRIGFRICVCWSKVIKYPFSKGTRKATLY